MFEPLWCGIFQDNWDITRKDLKTPCLQNDEKKIENENILLCFQKYSTC